MPEFASQQYWDARFSKDKSPFDWLVPAQALRDIAASTIQEFARENSQVLHIGCGTSDSSSLRSLVADPSHILNVDYSKPAIDAASERENELLAKEEQLQQAIGDDEFTPTVLQKSMRWSCLDLTSLDPVLEVLEQQVDLGQLFDIVLDKSTSDSISCGQDISVDLPYPLSINGWTRQIAQSGVKQTFAVHPLHLLAVHLAALTTPGSGRWIVVSYSEDRFPFVPPFPANGSHGLLLDQVVKAGFPHPHQLWRLERKEPIVHEETLAERKKRLSSGYVHRPQVSLWLYVLARTDALVTY